MTPRRYAAGWRLILPVLLCLCSAARAGTCLLTCNATRGNALSACEHLPAQERAACLETAFAAYDACTEACAATLTPVVLRGDANRDGVLDLADGIFLLSELFAGGSLSSCPAASDANGDGTVDIADPIAILDYLFRSAEPLPAPAVVGGPDPAGSQTLGCYGNAQDVPPLDLLLPRDTRIATFALG